MYVYIYDHLHTYMSIYLSVSLYLFLSNLYATAKKIVEASNACFKIDV